MTDYTKEIHDRAAYCDRVGMNGTAHILREYAHLLECTPEPDALRKDRILQWAVSRWHDEVANRPLVNVHRRTLDDTWRQVIRHCGGDDIALLGRCHDDLWVTTGMPAPEPSAKRGEIVITTNSTGTECYVVSRQDSEGRILETLWEAPARSDEPSAEHWKSVIKEDAACYLQVLLADECERRARTLAKEGK